LKKSSAAGKFVIPVQTGIQKRFEITGFPPTQE